jgi:hypothetical protein
MNSKSLGPVIHLHIESLVVRGLAPMDESALSAALQEALRCELRSIPSLHNAALPRAQAALTLPVRCGAQQLGGVLAQALAGVIGSGETASPAPDDISQGDRHG